jgi:hypothetical protein
MDLIKLNQFPAVAANSVATLVTDELRGQSVHALVFEMGGTTFDETHLSNLMVRLDGKVLFDGISGAQLKDLNEYEGLTSVGDYLIYFFGDPTAQTIRGQHLGDLDLSIYPAPLEIQCTIGGATAPTLQVHAVTGVPKLSMNLGYEAKEAAQIRALIRTVIQPSAAVTRKTFGISLGSTPGARLRRLGFFHSNLTSVEYKKQSLIKHDDVSIALNSAIQQQYARVPQSGLYMLDRMYDGNQGEAETTVDPNGKPWNQQMALTTSGGDTITAFADVHAAWSQL